MCKYNDRANELELDRRNAGSFSGFFGGLSNLFRDRELVSKEESDRIEQDYLDLKREFENKQAA